MASTKQKYFREKGVTDIVKYHGKIHRDEDKGTRIENFDLDQVILY